MNKLAALILLAPLACSHATKVEKPDQQGQSDGSEAKQPTQAQGGAAAKPAQARRPAKPGRPPLAAGPEGLYSPGSVEQIQKALAQHGYLQEGDESGHIDETTSAAVRKFQGDSSLARTGVPDHETVRKLGLDPDKIFRQSDAQQEKK